MYRRDKTVLVVGATGRQGGAVVKHLLEDGWGKVRALSHHPNAPADQALAAAGVELAPGDLLDRGSLFRACEGAYGVFSMQGLQNEPDVEEMEGNNVADAAREAGVQHLVYNSVEGAQSEGGAPWVGSKHRIEAHIRSLRLPATIWRPVTFMENYLRQHDEILAGHLPSPMWPESMAYMIALDDIGRFVALAFREPERFIGTEMAIAGDAMRMSAVAQTFAGLLDRPVRFEHVENERIPSPPRPKPGDRQPARADIAACRELIPDLMTLRRWIESGGWVRPEAPE
jgi:uncharacterized protein YbjT (DUF2867 family)